ncbi:MAG: metallophosphoesterase [Ignavibacteriales bacterium]|nr:metallophosphoesterase [Ignavibacteriales bacterium]
MNFIRIIILLIIIFLIEGYFGLKIWKALKKIIKQNVIKTAKIVIIIYFIFSNIYLFIILLNFAYRYFSGNFLFVNVESNWIDYFLIYPFWINLIIMVQSNLFFIVLDLLHLILLIFGNLKKKYLKFKPILVIVIAGIFFLFVPIKIYFDLDKIDVDTIYYCKQNLPENLDGYKIAFISDIHLDRYTEGEKIDKFINLLNQQNPDLVLIGGDLVSSYDHYVDKVAEILSQVKSSDGIYSCVGDHDSWIYRESVEKSKYAIMTALNEKNILMLDNENIFVQKDSSTIGITFATKTYIEKIPQYKLDTLSNFRSNIKIMVVHQPDENIIRESVRNNYDLMFSGHTHGGQITFIFPFLNLTPTMFETKYIKGEYWFDNMLYVISDGLGMSIAPIRYNSNASIKVIICKNK